MGEESERHYKVRAPPMASWEAFDAELKRRREYRTCNSSVTTSAPTRVRWNSKVPALCDPHNLSPVIAPKPAIPFIKVAMPSPYLVRSMAYVLMSITAVMEVRADAENAPRPKRSAALNSASFGRNLQ